MSATLLQAQAALSFLTSLLLAVGALTALSVIAASLCKAWPAIGALRALIKDL